MDNKILCKVLKNSLKNRVFEIRDERTYFIYKIYGVNLSCVKILRHPTLIFNVDIPYSNVVEFGDKKKNKLIRSLIIKDLKNILVFYEIYHHITHVVNVGTIRWNS